MSTRTAYLLLGAARQSARCPVAQPTAHFGLSVVQSIVAAMLMACADKPHPLAVDPSLSTTPSVSSGGIRPTDLGTLGSYVGGGTAVNGRGDVAGGSRTTAGLDHAFRWTARTGMVDLGTLVGVGFSQATGINASGQVHAVIWPRSGAARDLGTLGGDHAIAFAINERGEVAGHSSPSTGQHIRAVLMETGRSHRGSWHAHRPVL